MKTIYKKRMNDYAESNVTRATMADKKRGVNQEWMKGT